MNKSEDLGQHGVDAEVRRLRRSYRISEAERADIIRIAIDASLHGSCFSLRHLVEHVYAQLWMVVGPDGHPRLVPADERPSVHQVRRQLRKLSALEHARLLQRRLRFVPPER